MSYIETFDDFDHTETMSDYQDVKPFALREAPSNKEKTLEWLNMNFDQMEKKAQSRIISYQRWSYLYKGIHWRNVDHRDSRYGGRDAQYAERKPRMVDNFIMEFVDARVAQMARFGTNFSAIPWNNEINDENVAKACEKLLKGRSDEMDFDKLQRDADKIKYKFGTVFIMFKWDKQEGPMSPEYKELSELYPEGIPKDILKKLKRENIKIGDVCGYTVTPDRVYPELNKECWSEVNHIDEVSWVNIHELKADYPKPLFGEVRDNQRNYYDYSTHELTKPADQVMVRHFYHKPTKHLPEGAYIKYTDSAVLEWTSYPFKHDKLPFIIDKDIEIENELFGRPAIAQIEQMQRHYNNIASAQARDLGLGSAPKWMVPAGAADFRTINNEFTIVEFRGPVAPQLVKNNPISSDGLTIQDRMERRMSKHMKVYDISRGEVPTGVTANSALRFLDEQESQVLADDERKRKKRVLESYRMMVSIMAQYYKPDDGRTLRTLGKNNQYMIEDMQKADFNKVFDVQFQNTSALPDTKTGKISAIIDLNAATQTDPIFRREDIINMLDLATDETFTEEATFALDCAKTMFAKLLEGEEVPEPEMHDDLMVFYTTFYRGIQSYQFKKSVPDELKARVYDHIKTIEGLIFLKMTKNQKLAMEVQMLSYFPSFFELPESQMAATPAEQNAEMEAMQTQDMENTNRVIEEAQTKEAEQQ
jgi:hypothetical protein